VIPHIGSVLSADLEASALGRGRDPRQQVGEQRAARKYLRPEQIVIDLIHLDRAKRPEGAKTYEGICW
jgi:hypothetical protein